MRTRQRWAGSVRGGRRRPVATPPLLLLALILTGCVSSEPAASVGVPDSRAPVDAVATHGPHGVWPIPAASLRTVRTRPVVPIPSPHLIVEANPHGSSRSSGTASWFCGHGSSCTRGYPDGLYAAAGPRLRIGDWRGRLVRVESAGRTVVVRLIDWCFCGGGRLLDLYSSAFERLAPLSRGLVNVEVSW